MAEQTANKSHPQPERPAHIRIESEKGVCEITITAVSHLLADIEDYNRQFSMGSIMANLLIGLVDKKPGSTSGLSQEEDRQKMTASVLAVVHKNTLESIGLVLEPVSGKIATIYGLGEQASEGQMRINISNGNQFSSFLEALTPQQIEGTDIKQNLESLSGVLSQQVLDSYDLKEPNDEALQLFGNLDTVVKQYKRLGMVDSIERLETYLMHAKQGDLREYVVIERERLFSEPGKSFGPAEWQTDSTPESLKNMWNRALLTLKATRKNPKAEQLYRQLQEHLSKCIRIAREDVASRDYSFPDELLHWQEKGDVLERIDKELEEMMLF